MDGSVGVALGGTLLGSDQLGCVVLGAVLLGVVELGFVLLELVLLLEFDGFVELLDALELDDGCVELVLAEESVVLLSELGAVEELDSSGTSLLDDSVTGISDSPMDSSGTIPSVSCRKPRACSEVVPVSTIKEVSVVSSPAFNAPLRKPASPPRKTRMPHAPTMIFFMALVLS